MIPTFGVNPKPFRHVGIDPGFGGFGKMLIPVIDPNRPRLAHVHDQVPVQMNLIDPLVQGKNRVWRNRSARFRAQVITR